MFEKRKTILDKTHPYGMIMVTTAIYHACI